jgi:tetratricopeptide (TPR) repeat protein
MRDDDDAWVHDLQLLLDAYPPGHRKAGAGRWDDVRAALLGIRSSCGLDVDPDELEDFVSRHTRGLLDNFLAHSRRYATPASEAEAARLYERALAYYEEAARLFEQGEETWELAWTLFETAELHADQADLERARTGWRRAVEVAVEEDDWELTANLHRLVADIRWQEGATAGAFDAHGLALLHAYLFQCKTASRRPDAYTVTFYREQLERVFERLRTVDGAALEDAVARLAEPFGGAPVAADVAAALASGEPARLAGLVCPAAPADGELMEVRSDFTRRVHLLAEDLGADPARDLEQVEP